MCLCPVRIPNPYLAGRFSYDGRKVFRSSDRLRSSSNTIEVPCGRCSECLSRRYTDLMQRVYVESMTSYVFMVTLTYNNKHVPRLSFTSEEFTRRRRLPVSRLRCIYYSDFSHLQLLFKRLRNDSIFADRDFRYLAVSEYGTEKCRPHFHLIFFVARRDGDSALYGSHLESSLIPLFKKYFSINVGTRKNPIYEPLFDDVTRKVAGKLFSTFDLHLVRPRDVDGNYYDGDALSSSGTVASYIFSYVNSPSRFESYVSRSLQNLRARVDESVVSSFSRLLKTRCVYSHQLGFGFDLATGRRVVPVSDVPLPCSSYLATRLELYNSLPDNYSEFVSAYPDLASSYDYFWNVESRRRRLSDAFLNFRTWFYLHPHVWQFFVVALKYEPTLPDSFVRYHKFADQFSSVLPSVDISLDRSSFLSSVAYKYVSSAVNDSILSSDHFRICVSTEASYKYVPLCSYYKRYFVKDSDVLALYDANSFTDYDAYISAMRLKERSISDRVLSSSVSEQVSSDLRRSRQWLQREIQKMNNYFVYSEDISIFVPDLLHLFPVDSSDGSSLPFDHFSCELKQKRLFNKYERLVKRAVI